MNYRCGTIIMRKGIKFKDGGYDTRKFGHPTITTYDLGFDDEYAYFLTATSSVELYPSKEEEYYLASASPSGLKKPSLINLKFIYKVPHSFQREAGCLTPSQFVDMIKKFVDYQLKVPDEYFSEIYPRIVGYLN
jgi:hypothetical protein